MKWFPITFGGIALLILCYYMYWNYSMASVPSEWSYIKIGMTRIDCEKQLGLLDYEKIAKQAQADMVFTGWFIVVQNNYNPMLHRKRWQMRVTFANGDKHKTVTPKDKEWNDRIIDKIIGVEISADDDAVWSWWPFPHPYGIYHS